MLVSVSIKAFRSRPLVTRNYRQSTERMVVYWSIKSAIDLAGYAVGATDKFQGTGVFNTIKFEREKKEAAADASSSKDSKVSSESKGKVSK